MVRDGEVHASPSEDALPAFGTCLAGTSAATVSRADAAPIAPLSSPEALLAAPVADASSGCEEYSDDVDRVRGKCLGVGTTPHTAVTTTPTKGTDPGPIPAVNHGARCSSGPQAAADHLAMQALVSLNVAAAGDASPDLPGRGAAPRGLRRVRFEDHDEQPCQDVSVGDSLPLTSLQLRANDPEVGFSMDRARADLLNLHLACLDTLSRHVSKQSALETKLDSLAKAELDLKERLTALEAERIPAEAQFNLALAEQSAHLKQHRVEAEKREAALATELHDETARLEAWVRRIEQRVGERCSDVPALREDLSRLQARVGGEHAAADAENEANLQKIKQLRAELKRQRRTAAGDDRSQVAPAAPSPEAGGSARDAPAPPGPQRPPPRTRPLDDGVDRRRPSTDPHYLRSVIWDLFRQADTGHRDLIPCAAFSRTLSDLGLHHSTPEVEHILQHCTVTDDGHVHCEDLTRIVKPSSLRATASRGRGRGRH